MPSPTSPMHISRDAAHVITSGLVLNLDPDSLEVEHTLSAIRSHPVFTLEERSGWQRPVVLEAESAEECERGCDWLRTLPGVSGVEVVFVHWDETEFDDEAV